VSKCIYWIEDASGQWCDLANRGCGCRGDDISCSMLGAQVTTALKAERRAVMREASLRAQKRRLHSLYER
jgi:hypothetical protein